MDYDEDHSTELMVEFDPRLADVWLAIIETGVDRELGEKLGWFLRMAYLRGYEDAFSEPQRGSLYRNLGLPVPKRRPAESRKAGGSGG